jgi:hypothetical protein
LGARKDTSYGGARYCEMRSLNFWRAKRWHRAGAHVNYHLGGYGAPQRLLLLCDLRGMLGLASYFPATTL